MSFLNNQFAYVARVSFSFIYNAARMTGSTMLSTNLVHFCAQREILLTSWSWWLVCQWPL